jgi:hypothetical protein
MGRPLHASNYPRGCQCAHLRHTRLLQFPRARLQRRSSRAHIVHQDDNLAANVACGRRCRERIANIAVTLRRRKTGLGRRGTHAPEGRHNAQTQMAGEIRRLVEAALSPARRVERHWDGARHVAEDVAAVLAHQRGQRPGERSAAFVLERMDDRSQGALVAANRSGPVDEPCGSPTPRAARERHADRPPGGQRIPTAVAERRRERQDRSPAPWADRTACRLVERLFARRAGRRQHDRQHGVERR